MAVTDQSVLLFVPETESERFETSKQRDWFHGLKQRLRLVASLKVVVGNPRAQVMYMMKPDVTGEPLQDFRKLVKRTAL